MTDMTAFERQLSGEISGLMGPIRPVDDAAIFTAMTATQSPMWRFTSMFSATKFVVAGAIVALFGGFLLAGVLTQLSDEPVPAVGVSPSPVSDPSPTVTDVIEVAVGGTWEHPLVVAGGALWVAGSDGAEGVVSRVDPATREVTDTIVVGSDPSSMVSTEDALWALGADGDLSRIDLTTRAVTEPFDGAFLPGGTYQIVAPLVIDGSLWVQRGSGDSASLIEIDLAQEAIINEYPWPWMHGADWMSEIDGAIWAWRKWPSRADTDKETLARFDLGRREFTFTLDMSDKDRRTLPFSSGDAIWSKNRGSDHERFSVRSATPTDTVRIGPGVAEAVVAEGAVWFAEGNSIHRVDLLTREVTDVIPVGVVGFPDINAYMVAYADGAIWVTSIDEGKVYRVDTDTREMTHTIEVGGEPGQPLSFDGAIWVPDEAQGTVTRIATGDAEDERPEVPPAESSPRLAANTTTPDLLPGVDLVTEEVEPGVYRVLSDGAGHDLVAEPPAGVTLAPDGSVWLLRRGTYEVGTPGEAHLVDGVYRLGQPATAVQSFEPSSSDFTDLAVDVDGVAWVSIGAQPRDGRWGYGSAEGTLASYDGAMWTTPVWPNGTGDVGAIEATADGAVWVARNVEDDAGPAVARIEGGEWTVLPTLCCSGREGHYRAPHAAFVAADDGTAWLANGRIAFGGDSAPGPTGLLHFDGRHWEVVDLPLEGEIHAGPIALGPDGTLWAYAADVSVDVPTQQYLLRLDADGWTVYSGRSDEWGNTLEEADGVPLLSTQFYYEARLAVDPDGRLWIAVGGDGGVMEASNSLYPPSLDPAPGPVGLLTFDGTRWNQYLKGLHVNWVDIADDGTVFATALYGCSVEVECDPYAFESHAGWDLGGLFVISPEAVAAAE